MTLGHEYSGTLAKPVGSPLDRKEGTPVVAGGGWGCGECNLCREGMGLYCKNRFSPGRNVDGCMAEFVKVDYRTVRSLPSAVSFDEAQNVVNVACAVRGFKKIPLPLGKTIAV